MSNTIRTLLAITSFLVVQWSPISVPISAVYSSKDVFAPAAQSLALQLEYENGSPTHSPASYSASFRYLLRSTKVAVPKGIYILRLSRYPSPEATLQRIITRSGASASNPPKMVDLSQTWKTTGYSLFDALPPRPESMLSWRAFIVDKTSLFEIRIYTSAPESFDPEGKVLRASSGDIDLPPLSREHGVLAKAILDEVYKRGKTLNLWGAG